MGWHVSPAIAAASSCRLSRRHRERNLRTMPHASTRYQSFFGPYCTPRFEVGALVKDAIHSELTIVGLTDARQRARCGTTASFGRTLQGNFSVALPRLS
jgi:hypothetical protein